MTRLDDAHARLAAAPDDADARAGYLGALSDTEILLRLVSEPQGDAIEPELIETTSGAFALGFDTSERFAGAAPKPMPYAALPGRIVAELLGSADIGLALNMGSGTETIVTPAELVWLCEQLDSDPSQTAGRVIQARAPGRLPEALLKALDTQLARAEGLARSAHLAAVTYDDGRHGHLLAIVNPAPGSEAAFARSIENALRFSGLDAAELDVAFFSPADPALERLAKVGMRYDLPQVQTDVRSAPGSDPNRPPKLR